MCRFCLASYLTLPFRAAPLGASLLPAIDAGLQTTRRLGLLGASVRPEPPPPPAAACNSLVAGSQRRKDSVRDDAAPLAALGEPAPRV